MTKLVRVMLMGVFCLSLFSGFAGAKDAIDPKDKTDYHPVIIEFKELIDNDPIVRMSLARMIEQIPDTYKEHHLKSIEDMLSQLNDVLTRAPEYNETLLVGTPFSEILIWTMGAPAGFEAYRNEKINAMLKKLLGAWSEFLNSKESLYVFNDTPKGWKCEKAMEKLNMSDYQYDPEDEYWGFKSWNDFFTRKLAKGARPVAEPENDKVIVSGCDATVYRISENVQKQSRFWIKSQPYSLNDMLANDESVDQFVGGSIYQAFLSPFNYHRWHSPISGTIKKAYVKEGLYFGQVDAVGEDPTDQDKSEGYITHVQTRALIFIEADDPAIGLMCFMPVGMVEISSCIINENIKAGYHVEKGEELGYFQFGGSTHCLIFRPGVIKEFNAEPNKLYKVGERIGTSN
ncbi:phosphatidylserine decarboxylase family protein [Candidatus Omnitrophota bacterium]